MSDSLAQLQILQEVVTSCIKCPLHSTRNNTVFSRGNPKADICIIGEAPGQDEDEQGLPFVGRSGQLLDKILTELGLDIKQDIYIANIIKCRPPGNRKPSEEEVNSCIDYLDVQIKLVNPKVIIALGNTAVAGLLPIDMGITKIRGNFYKRGKVWVMPTYHPSYLLRNNSPTSEPHVQFRQDIMSVINKLQELKTIKE